MSVSFFIEVRQCGKCSAIFVTAMGGVLVCFAYFVI